MYLHSNPAHCLYTYRQGHGYGYGEATVELRLRVRIGLTVRVRVRLTVRVRVRLTVGVRVRLTVGVRVGPGCLRPPSAVSGSAAIWGSPGHDCHSFLRRGGRLLGGSDC